MHSRKMGTVDCSQHQHSRNYTLNTIFIIKFAKKKKKKRPRNEEACISHLGPRESQDSPQGKITATNITHFDSTV